MSLNKKQYKYLALASFITWISFISFILIDSFGVLGLPDIGTINALQISTFTRAMFFDIGILSTIFAVWIILFTEHKLKYLFAILTMFLGSIALLPYLAIHFWKKSK